MNRFNAVLIFTPEVFFLCKKEWSARGSGGRTFDILHSFIVLLSNSERSQRHVLIYLPRSFVTLNLFNILYLFTQILLAACVEH